MSCLLYLLLWGSVFVCIQAELPANLDDFMGKLFEHEECEDFISGEYNAVATTECTPFICAFPMQICMRPAAKFTDKSTNTCKDIPSACLTAANGGVPIGPPRLPTPAPVPPLILTVPQVDKTPKVMPGGPEKPVISRPPLPITADICQMGPPNGRFCGFKIMFTYNKETLECDEFWFPGCRTEETNANLFDDYQSCFKVAQMCKPTTAAPTTTPAPVIFQTPRPTRRPPPPPPVQPPPAPAGGLGALGGLGGFLGSGTGPGPGQPVAPDGNGEDMNLFGFIKQGIDSAQKIRQGGPGGKQAAAQAATNILQQFTGFDFNNVGGSLGNFGGFFGG